MSRHVVTRKIPSAQNRELQVAAAVAREAVVQLHVDHALDLIRQAAGSVRDLPVLDIYLRLLDLSAQSGEVVTNRVLAALGHAPVVAAAAPEPAADSSEPVDDPTLLQVIRRRLRGRVNHAFRRTVELRTGVVKVALLELHVAHARGFVKLLGDSHSMSEACTVYTALVPMPSPLAAVLYMMVLDRIAAEESGGAWSTAPVGAQSPPAREPKLASRSAPRPSRARTSA